MRTSILAATLGIGFLVVGAHIHTATAMTMDCSEGETMMLKAHSMVQGTPTMTGNVDKDFAAMEMQSSKAQIMMAQVAMKCGKTAAVKQSAAKLLKESQDRLELLREQGLRPELRS